MADELIDVALLPEQWARVLAALKHISREFAHLPYAGPQKMVSAAKETVTAICAQLGIEE